MKRLGALEALGRGIANVRGNLEVVGVAAAGTIVLTGLVLLSLVPWLGLDQDGLEGLFRVAAGRGQPSDLASLGRQLWAVMSDLWGFLLAVSVAGTVAFAAYCWYYGGILGVLYAGDAQAPPGPRRDAALFRTWSFRFFAGESSRLAGRLLGFYTVWSLIGLAVLGLLGGAAALVAALAGGASGAAALAVGCGVALPLAFVFFAIVGAMSLGQVELVPPGNGVLEATRAGTRLLGRRLLAVCGLFALFVLAAIAIALVEGGVALVVAGALAAWPFAAAAAQIALFVVQVMLSTLINLVLAAAFVALVRSERRLESAPAA